MRLGRVRCRTSSDAGTSRGAGLISRAWRRGIPRPTATSAGPRRRSSAPCGTMSASGDQSSAEGLCACVSGGAHLPANRVLLRSHGTLQTQATFRYSAEAARAHAPGGLGGATAACPRAGRTPSVRSAANSRRRPRVRVVSHQHSPSPLCFALAACCCFRLLRTPRTRAVPRWRPRHGHAHADPRGHLGQHGAAATRPPAVRAADRGRRRRRGRGPHVHRPAGKAAAAEAAVGLGRD